MPSAAAARKASSRHTPCAVAAAARKESSRHTPCAVAADGTRSVPATLVAGPRALRDGQSRSRIEQMRFLQVDRHVDLRAQLVWAA